MLMDFICRNYSCFQSVRAPNVFLAGITVLVIWRAYVAGFQYANRPRNMIISGKTLMLGQWLSSLDFIYQGSKRIARTYVQAAGAPFAVLALSNYQVLVSCPEDVQMLATASEDVMSFRKALFDRLFFTYTMGGFTPNHIDPHNSIPVRVFKVLARENLPKLSNPIAARVAEVFQEFFEAGSTSETLGTSTMPLHTLCGTLVARMNNELLFGYDLAMDRNFEKDSIKFGWDSAIAMEIFRQIPSCLVPVIAKIFMAWSGAMHRVTKRVQILVCDRIRERNYRNKSEREHQDGTDWVISSSHTPEQAHPLRIAQQMMALLFASTHQMQMALTWAIVDLCLHPDYITLLRKEIEDARSIKSGDFHTRLPLLECFLRESSRLNPLDSLNMQRKTMVPFEFNGGLKVPPGNLVAIPQREIMRDHSRYVSPELFDPYRFWQASASTEAVTKYTDVNWNYPFWGSPHLPCPGRWYASYAIKHVLVHLLTTFDFDLIGKKDVKRHFTWTTAIVPKRNINITVRKRLA